jgi:hypothetical protein
LIETNIADYLIQKLNKQRISIINDMIKGDLPEVMYKRQAGVLYGLQYAIDLISYTADQVAEDKELNSDE